MDGRDVPIIEPCRWCGSEGRIYRDSGRYDDQGPIINDHGQCDACDGTGAEVIEDLCPITETELWRDIDHGYADWLFTWRRPWADLMMWEDYGAIPIILMPAPGRIIGGRVLRSCTPGLTA